MYIINLESGLKKQTHRSFVYNYIKFKKGWYFMNDKNFIIEDGVLVEYTGNETEVVIPDSVTRIGNYAFAGSKLEEITIPCNVELIGHAAFRGCELLKTVTILSRYLFVERTNQGAFSRCRSLEKLVIPDQNSIIDIGKRTFPKHEFTICCKPNSYAERYLYAKIFSTHAKIEYI